MSFITWFNDNREIILAFATIGTAMIGVGAFVKNVIEYSKQNALRRFEAYKEISDMFDDDKDIKQVVDIFNGNKDFSNIEAQKLIKFASLYENIALMTCCGIMNYKVAYYMFGYYAVRCWNDKNFWKEIEKAVHKELSRESDYWTLFSRFAEDAENAQINSERGDAKRWRPTTF